MGILKLTKRTDNFGKLIAASSKTARALELKHTKAWKTVMVQIMPEDTGAMKRSTEVVQTTRGGYGIQIGVSYWRFVNDGTIYFEGYHFVEESREFVRRGFIADLKGFVRLLRGGASLALTA